VPHKLDCSFVLDCTTAFTATSGIGSVLSKIVSLTDLYKYSIQMPYLLFTPNHIM